MSSTEFGKHDRTLVALVTQYQTLAMVSLGKIQNPATGQVERDLEQARIFIDILEMLKVKCRTDTPEDILRLLDSSVMDLQLNYLDEKKKDAEAQESEDHGSGAQESEDRDAPAENKDQQDQKQEDGAEDPAGEEAGP